MTHYKPRSGEWQCRSHSSPAGRSAAVSGCGASAAGLRPGRLVPHRVAGTVGDDDVALGASSGPGRSCGAMRTGRCATSSTGRSRPPTTGSQQVTEAAEAQPLQALPVPHNSVLVLCSACASANGHGVLSPGGRQGVEEFVAYLVAEP